MPLRTLLATLTAGLAAATTTLAAAGPVDANSPQSHACSSSVSIDALLVLERGFTAGVGNTVRLYLAETRRATDTTGVPVLTGEDGVGVRLVRKTFLADIVNCPTLGATAKQPQPNPLLDNIEGMTVMPVMPVMTVTGQQRRYGGQLRVLLVSDDNQNAVQTTRFYSLRVRVA